MPDGVEYKNFGILWRQNFKNRAYLISVVTGNERVLGSSEEGQDVRILSNFRRSHGVNLLHRYIHVH